MYGLIAKLTLTAGHRDEMIVLFKESAASMPGCLSYVVSKDIADQNILWVTEVWDSAQSHDASLSLAQVKNVIPRARAIVANFEKVAVTNPICDLGFDPAFSTLESTPRK